MLYAQFKLILYYTLSWYDNKNTKYHSSKITIINKAAPKKQNISKFMKQKPTKVTPKAGNSSIVEGITHVQFEQK